MSGTAPDPQKPQLSESAMEENINHHHKCTCDEIENFPKIETGIVNNHIKTPQLNNRHLNNQCNNHNCSQNRESNKASSTKTNVTTTSTPKIIQSNCTCHLQDSQKDKDDVNNLRKFEADDRIEISPLPPALPPRPPPRPRFDSSLGSRYRNRNANPTSGESKKYVFCCTVCGGLVTILGSLFLTVYFLLRSLTSTLNYFETIPSFVPATMLILTGILVMILSKRKYRNNYLIKVCGLCCLICALTCVLVTITTTVIHMNRLQSLRECVYTKKTRTCTCYSVLLEAQSNADEGMRFVFDSTPDCEVIHGELYTCLRTMFGISVTGILVCIFSCMLMYQLLSHEKKKMYWEQLELRCRSFYQQHTNPPSSAHGSVREPPMPSTIYCSCCEECRYPPLPMGPQVYPWDAHNPTERFWNPGRMGNFYSPNPGDMPPADILPNRSRTALGWNWRRLPWTRNTGAQQEIPRDSTFVYQGIGSSADSQYGFSSRPGNENEVPRDPTCSSSDSYSMLDNRPPLGGVYIWGPPPPYSNPNSPARRIFHSPARYQHLHHHSHGHESHCQMNQENTNRNSRRARQLYPNTNKQNYENTTQTEVHQNNENSESTDTSSCLERISHTLPARKMKKRNDLASVKNTYHQGSSNSGNKVNVQSIFKQTEAQDQFNSEEHGYTEPNLPETPEKLSGKNVNEGQNNQKCRFLPRLQGVENAAFQKQEGNSGVKNETAESEVYFADVSSCCNISVKNDGQDSLLYDEAIDGQKIRLENNLCPQEKHHDQNMQEEEDYLAQRMASRQMSVRSRMPVPLPPTEELVFQTETVQLLTKEISQNSLGSSVQTPLTESTDDALTPVENRCQNFFTENDNIGVPNPNTARNFSPVSQYLAPDAQYEAVKNPQEDFSNNRGASTTSSSNLTHTISGLNNFGQNYYPKNNFSYIPPGNKNGNQKLAVNAFECRKNTGSNISNLIQNLSANSGGLLYGEASAGEEDLQAQSCNSDATMDSGWQSGSEKNAESRNGEGAPV